jgi:hypothetical protein
MIHVCRVAVMWGARLGGCDVLNRVLVDVGRLRRSRTCRRATPLSPVHPAHPAHPFDATPRFVSGRTSTPSTATACARSDWRFPVVGGGVLAMADCVSRLLSSTHSRHMQVCTAAGEFREGNTLEVEASTLVVASTGASRGRFRYFWYRSDDSVDVGSDGSASASNVSVALVGDSGVEGAVDPPALIVDASGACDWLCVVGGHVPSHCVCVCIGCRRAFPPLPQSCWCGLHSSRTFCTSDVHSGGAVVGCGCRSPLRGCVSCISSALPGARARAVSHPGFRG